MLSIYLQQLRPLCLRLPEVTETVTFGNPTFQVKTKTFAVLEQYRGSPTLAVKVGKSRQPVFLQDERFFRTPYLGQHGWVSLRLSQEPDWMEVETLVQGSYELVSQGPRRR